MKTATLTLNPCVDKTLYFSSAFATGELNRAAYSVLHGGGKGINVSRILRQLGVNAPAYGFLGGKTGELLASLLEEEQILTMFTPTRADTRLCVKLIDADGVCTEANEMGGPVLESEYAALKKALYAFSCDCKDCGEVGYLFAGGSVPQGLASSAYRELASLLYEWGGHVRMILDTGGDALKESILTEEEIPRPYLIKPNEAELSAFLGYTLDGEGEEKAVAAAKASRRIFSTYDVNVLCTLGADGAV